VLAPKKKKKITTKTKLTLSPPSFSLFASFYFSEERRKKMAATRTIVLVPLIVGLLLSVCNLVACRVEETNNNNHNGDGSDSGGKQPVFTIPWSSDPKVQANYNVQWASLGVKDIQPSSSVFTSATFPNGWTTKGDRHISYMDPEGLKRAQAFIKTDMWDMKSRVHFINVERAREIKQEAMDRNLKKKRDLAIAIKELSQDSSGDGFAVYVKDDHTDHMREFMMGVSSQPGLEVIDQANQYYLIGYTDSNTIANEAVTQLRSVTEDTSIMYCDMVNIGQGPRNKINAKDWAFEWSRDPETREITVDKIHMRDW